MKAAFRTTQITDRIIIYVQWLLHDLLHVYTVLIMVMSAVCKNYMGSEVNDIWELLARQ